MPHPLVLQLRFTRSEFLRALKNVSEEDGTRRIEPMNSISWIVGHLAWQEQLYWLTRPQGITPAPEVNKVGSGRPMSVPSLEAMWQGWHMVTESSNAWLDTLTSADLKTHVMDKTKNAPFRESIGSQLRRTTYHYWYHMGESQAIRQLLGHTGLPSFVGDIHDKAPYIPETD